MRISTPASFLALTYHGVSATLASPLPAAPRANTPPFPARTIFQFGEPGTWLENIAVRPNGDLLVTMLAPNASLYTLRAPPSGSPEISLVHAVDDRKSLLGITETEPDTFVFLAGEFDVSSGAAGPEPFAAWEVSFGGGGGASPQTRKVADLDGISLGNGIASLPGPDANIVLIGDTTGGSAWRLDTRTGAHEMILQIPEMQAPANASSQVGINGLKFRDGYLYWSNSALVSVFRIALDGAGYPVSGAAAERVATVGDAGFLDDFAFDERGDVWAASNVGNEVYVIRQDGSSEVVVGAATELTVAGDTAAAFGRTSADSQTLYVVTGGALNAPVNGSITEPAKVVAVDTAGFIDVQKK